MDHMKILAHILVFLIGFLSCLLMFLTFYSGEVMGIPLNINTSNASDQDYNIKAPGDWIKSNQIYVYEEGIIIDIEGAKLSSYANTGSMIPVLDEKANGIMIKPKSAGQIKVGDIIIFEDGDLVVHRVVEIGEDKEGVYFITKGDNNRIDDGKVRFNQIKYVTVAVIY